MIKLFGQPQALISDLSVFIQTLGLDKGTVNSLVSGKLDNAVTSLAKGNADSAAAQLNAFINEVKAQAGKKLLQDVANELIRKANFVLYVMSLNGTAG